MRCAKPKPTALELLGDQWVLTLLSALRKEEKRFTDLQRELCINPITLSNRLRTLEDNNLLQRLAGTVNKQAVSYRLTELGRGTFPILDAVKAFEVPFSQSQAES